MGLPPNKSATPGDECVQFANIYGLPAPAEVLLVVGGIELFFGAVDPSPDGNITLQQDQPCVWIGFKPPWAYSFTAQLGVEVRITRDTPPFRIAFLKDQATGSTFENGLICGNVDVVGENGTAIVAWGPEPL